MSRERILAILVAAGFLVAACGGSSPTAAPGETTSAQTTSAGETTSDETTTGETTSGETTSGGGPSSAKACDLLTADEVEQATGYTDIEPQPIAASDTDALSGCGFVSGGVFPAATLTILDPANTNTDPSGYLSLPGSEEVSVSGGRAVFVPAAGNIMFVFKGSTVATMLIVPQQGDFKSAAEALVQKVLDRL